ncbi:MAG TPA: hypothetical protein VK743_20680 [Steroidobacteraceae bacterium]|jgi:hypothetical protein|nr:hypothetical protein [Steroidobacteraceae bacterium]
MNPSTFAIALILAAAATTATAATSDADMMRCAAIPTRDARLDCFDALAHQLSGKAAAPTATRAPAPLSAAAPAASPPAAQAPPAAAVSPAAIQAPPAAGDPKNFGLTAAQQHTVDVGPQMITANISNLGSNQKGDTFVVLDNGQTWSVTDNDGWLATGQAVRIKRAAMGAYLMLIPSNHSYHVRRLK